MDAGNPHQPRQLFGFDTDEIPLFAPGPNGEVQISTEDAGIPQPAGGPYVITGDENQPTTVDPGPPLTIPIPITTQIPLSMATDSPITFSAIPLSRSEGQTGSTPPSTTATAYSQTASSPSPTAQPTSSTVTVTSSPSSESQRVTFSTDTTVVTQSTTSSATLVRSSRTVSTVSVSAASTSSFTSSTISTSRSLSMTTISISSSSIQTIVISSSVVSSSVFTSSFSSASSRNSSAIASSTSTIHTPTQTVTAPPLPGTGSNLNVHSPPYYVGIVFGTIAGMALIAALIAWWIRLRSHSKRRRLERTLVPWARSDDDDDGGLEAGHGRLDSTKGWPWTPRGDRDVGEPKRSESYMNGSQWSLHNHAIPGHNLFSAESFGALSSIDGYTPAGVRHKLSQRHAPARLGGRNEDVMHSNNYGRQLFVVNDVPSSLQPAYLSTDESLVKERISSRSDGGQDTLMLHLKQHDSRRTMTERLRNLGKHPPDPPVEGLDTLRTPGGTGAHAGTQAWGSSFKSSLVNAFNAVASNLATPNNAPQMPQDDTLAVPSAKAGRKSIHDNTIWDEKSSGLHRDHTRSSVSSKPWTLEETGNGAGIVHLRMSEADMLPKTPHRPSMPAPNLSFGDGDSISTYSEKESIFHRIPTRESQVPLIASSKPLPVHVRPDNYFARQVSSDTIPAVNQLVSRNSTTFRSAASAVTPSGGGSRGKHESDLAFNFSGAPRIPPGIDHPGFSERLKGGDSGKDSVVIQPDTISRISSTDTSILASTIDTTCGERSEMAAASRALKDRQRKASQGVLR